MIELQGILNSMILPWYMSKKRSFAIVLDQKTKLVCD